MISFETVLWKFWCNQVISMKTLKQTWVSGNSKPHCCIIVSTLPLTCACDNITMGVVDCPLISLYQLVYSQYSLRIISTHTMILDQYYHLLLGYSTQYYHCHWSQYYHNISQPTNITLTHFYYSYIFTPCDRWKNQSTRTNKAQQCVTTAATLPLLQTYCSSHDDSHSSLKTHCWPTVHLPPFANTQTDRHGIN